MAQIDEIVNICREMVSISIEDSAESLGASFVVNLVEHLEIWVSSGFNGNKMFNNHGGGILISDNLDG